MAEKSLPRGPYGLAQIASRTATMKAIGTLAPIEPEMLRIYKARAEGCLSKARDAAIGGYADIKQHFLDEARFWASHAETISTGLRGDAS